MTYEEMSAVFDNLIDKEYTGFFDYVSKNQIFNIAQANVVERKYGDYQVNRNIPDELLGLVNTDDTSFQGLNATTATLPTDYYHYLASEITYDIDGEEVKVTPYAPTSDMRYVRDPYDSPNVIKPHIRISDQIYIEPSDTNVKDLILVYMRKGNEINVLDDQTEPVYNEKMQYLVIYEAKNIAMQKLRDQFGYQTSEQEIAQNP